MENSILGKLEIALERKIYQNSFYEFFKVAFCQLHPDKPLEDNWHIKYLCDVLQKETERIIRREQKTKDIIINIPPRSLKSYITSVIWPVWSWTLDPSLKFATISYSSDIALILSRLSKNLILSPWFQRLYGSKIVLKNDVTGAAHYETTKTGMRKAIGMNGAITGIGFDVLLFDDPLSPEQGQSEKERENAWRQFKETFFNRLNDALIGLRVTIMQRLHEGDQTGELMNEKTGSPQDHLHICIPAEYDEEMIKPPELKKFYVNGLFSPTTFPPELLSTYKRMLGTLGYAGQYRQRPTPAEGNLFKRAWFEIVSPNLVSRNEDMMPTHFVLDTAYTDKHDENDPTGILSAFSDGKYIYLINYIEVYKKFPDLCKFVPTYVTTNGYTGSSSINIEPKANGMPIVERLQEATSLNVMKIEVEGKMPDKMQKASAISPICQAGKVRLVEGAWNEEFLSSLCAFPRARHDEVVDCLYYMIDKLSPIRSFDWTFV